MHSERTTTATATWRGWISAATSRSSSGRTRSTRTTSSTTRRHSSRSSTSSTRTESAKLAVYAQHLPDMERNLPEPEQYKNHDRGTSSPIKVVQELYTAGDARRGVQTSAFNLPNDEFVREKKGSKKVLLKNVMEAKFRQSGKPIALRVLDPSLTSLVSFDAYLQPHPLPRAVARPRAGLPHAARRRARRSAHPAEEPLLRRSKSARPTSSASGTSATRIDRTGSRRSTNSSSTRPTPA